MKMKVTCKKGTDSNDCSECPFRNEMEFGTTCNMFQHLKYSKDGNTNRKTVFTITMSGKGGKQK